MSRKCARITPAGPIEPENFDRRKRREHGDVVVIYKKKSYTTLTIVINLETHLPIFDNCPSCHKFASSLSSSWNSHEPATRLNFAVSDMRRVTWFWTLCRFDRLNWTRPDFFRIKYAKWCSFKGQHLHWVFTDSSFRCTHWSIIIIEIKGF